MLSAVNHKSIFDDEFLRKFEEQQTEISQWASQVTDWSSSYGSENSISYSALNICNRPSKFPAYGDFAETYHLLHYGPSEEIEYSVKDQNRITFHDFVVVQYEHYVFPKSIRIYETYNPGSVVRILAYCDIKKMWKILFEAEPEVVEKKSREFCPPIKEIDVPTRVLRIEFNHSLLDYYTGIDAVLLTGIKWKVRATESPEKMKPLKGTILQKLETYDFQPQSSPPETIEKFLKNDLNRFIEKVGLSPSPKHSHSPKNRQSNEKSIDDVPYEVLFKIFSYLDLKSLCRVSQVRRSFQSIVNDHRLYHEINLKFHWHLANTNLLNCLYERCKLIKKLDMSSCGYYESIKSSDFIKFIAQHGRGITHLKLNSSQFLNTSCLEAITRHCTNLTELSLRNYSSVTTDRDFSSLLKLSNLEYLDVSRTAIDNGTLLSILRNNRNLEALKIGFASPMISMDDVCMVISVFNPSIKTIDMWKSYAMSNRGLRALSECPMLEEINLGWTLRFDQESILTESLKLIVQNCKNLKRLDLSAVRGLIERDFENIANFALNLERLNLMGIVRLSSQNGLRILESCHKLELLDVSFCENIDDMTVLRWQNDYPNCKIQRSEVPA